MSSGSLTLDVISRHLEELNLLKCSLLQGEELVFIPQSLDAEIWESLLESYPDTLSTDSTLPSSPARFQIKSSDSRICFEVELPSDYGTAGGGECALVENMVSVKGDQITRAEQERWRGAVKECANELNDSEYPVFELISTHLLPRLHDTPNADDPAQQDVSTSSNDLTPTCGVEASQQRYHALLTSHHLISPTKRRNLQHWSAQFSLSGFARVGYPGVIYCDGTQSNVEEFVANIKAMQWLALRVRFVEPLTEDDVKKVGKDGNVSREGGLKEGRRWIEFEKVGEVVQEMRRIGREKYVVEMGIGSAGLLALSHSLGYIDPPSMV